MREICIKYVKPEETDLQKLEKKLEEEEKLNGDVLNELLSQKSTKAKQLQIEHNKVEELSNENKEH